jgi:7-cyano-7-deazaguanine synthase
MNKLSLVAREIMFAGLEQRDVEIPKDEYFNLANEVYNVPEKPKGYHPKKKGLSKEVAVLVTGGLDSTALYYWALKKYKKVRAFYIDIGSPYAKKEIEALHNLGMPVSIRIDEGFIGYEKEYWKHIIPARNLYFLSLVAEEMKGGTILFGATNGEMPIRGGDKSKRFIQLINKEFAKLPYPIKVEVPFADWTKGMIVAWMKKNKLIRQLGQTISCFSGEKGPCGACQSCLRKSMALITNGLYLKTNVDVRMGCKQYIKKYLKVLNEALQKKDFSHYSRRRCTEDLESIKLIQEL